MFAILCGRTIVPSDCVQRDSTQDSTPITSSLRLSVYKPLSDWHARLLNFTFIIYERLQILKYLAFGNN